MAKAPQQKFVTRKHQARLERERQQRRLIIVGAIVVAALVIGLLGFGLLDQLFLQKNRSVATVNGDRITVAEFQNQVSYNRYQQIQQLGQLVAMQQQLGSMDTTGYFSGMIQQSLASLTDNQTMGRQVLDIMINEVLIRQEAEKRGLTASEVEVDEAIQEAFGYFPNGTPTPAPTTALQPTATLSALQLTLTAPTITPTLSATATPGTEETPAATAAATAEPTEEAELTPELTPTSGPSATPLPTATPFTQEGFETSYDEFMANMNTQIDFTDEQVREIFRSQILYAKLLDDVTSDVERAQEQVWARHILVQSEEEAAAIAERLKDGENWDDVVTELQADEASQVTVEDLNWFGPGAMEAPFEEMAYTLTEVGEISDPVQTTFGWHVIQLLGREVRTLDDSEYENARQIAFSDWMEEVKSQSTIVESDTWQNAVPSEPAVPAELLQQAQPQG